jgi:hypothetical protein
MQVGVSRAGQPEGSLAVTPPAATGLAAAAGLSGQTDASLAAAPPAAAGLAGDAAGDAGASAGSKQKVERLESACCGSWTATHQR